MKTFTTSEELAKILLKNGFSEITKNLFPTHHAEILKNGYSDGKSKRAFGINSKDFVVFEYDMIKAYYKGGCKGVNMKQGMSSEEITSVIAFYNLPFQTRNALQRSGVAIPTLFQTYNYIKENPDYTNSSNKFIVNAFEKVALD